MRRHAATMGAALWALGCLAALVLYWCAWGQNQLDADMASEQVLANLLAAQPGAALLTDQWYYSTELRVLNTQLIMAPLFRVFASWHTVRVVGSVILIVLYLAAWFFFARQAGLRFGGLLGAGLLLLPWGELYGQYVLEGLYYIPHIALNFLGLGCALWALHKKGARRWAAGVLLCAASFAAGLGGPRQIAILQLPLTLAALLLAWLDRTPGVHWPKTVGNCLRGPYGVLLRLALLADAAGVAGYACNARVLAQDYAFQDQSYVTFGNVTFERLEQFVNALLAAFGWQKAAVFSCASLFNGVVLAVLAASFAFAVRLVRGRLSHPLGHRLLGAFYLALALCFLALYALTNSGHSERYLLPLAVLFIPLLEIYLADAAPKQSPMAATLAVGLAAVLALRGAGGYAQAAATGNAHAAAAEFLAHSGYTEGYASFWDANILTELSDGALEVWTLAQNDAFEVRKWLQKTEHLSREPKGKVFFVISNWEESGERQPAARGLQEAMPEEALIYEDGTCRIYGFASAAAMHDVCGL